MGVIISTKISPRWGLANGPRNPNEIPSSGRNGAALSATRTSGATWGVIRTLKVVVQPVLQAVPVLRSINRHSFVAASSITRHCPVESSRPVNQNKLNEIQL